MDQLISISAMAKLHGLSRQTLIHYDHIGLFKPAVVDEKGYRFYSRRQIPFLRKISFFRSLGIGLKAIMDCLQQHDPEAEMAFLRDYKQQVVEEITRLNKVREALSDQLSFVSEAVDGHAMNMGEPFIQAYPERKVLFKPFLQPIDREKLHLTVMSLWRQLFSINLLPSAGFGALLHYEKTKQNSPAFSGGSCIFIPVSTQGVENIKSLPAGDYACMYKSGMPYNSLHAEQLLDWIERQHYELAGDIVDVCLLDATFYQQDKNVDFCLLQAPVKAGTHSRR